MKQEPLEPGLLPALRVFSGLVVGLLALDLLEFLWKPASDGHPQLHLLVMIGWVGLLFGYLSVPGLERRLGAAYLPAALALFLAAPFSSQWLELGHPLPEYTNLARERLLLLLLPLLVVAWQYSSRAVLAYVVGTSLVDLGLTATAYPLRAWLASEYFWAVVMRALVLSICGLLVARLMRAQRAQREALRHANARLAHHAATLEQLAIGRERQRLACELHDTVAHTLSGLAVHLEAIKTLDGARSGATSEMLDRALATTRAGLGEVRRAIGALRAPVLEERGLIEAIRELADKAADRAGFRVQLEFPEPFAPLAPDVEMGLYRLAQEALENAARHSGARAVQVQLRRAGGQIVLCVADDGGGFDRAAPNEGFGLCGMHERADRLGGRLELETTPGKGTTVRFFLEE
jgi:signal transduction histidine kinase